MRLILGMCLLLISWGAHAACSGSGLTWTCTASGFTNADLQGDINSASDGATFTFSAGTYTNLTSISLNNIDGITLICETPGACIIPAAGDLITNDTCTADKVNLIRISGFDFTSTSATGTAKIWLYCYETGWDILQLRIDHNTISHAGTYIGIITGESSSLSTGKVYGVIDNNTFTAADNFMAWKNLSGGNVWVDDQQGTGNGMFFEDNVCDFTNVVDLGTGCVDIWRANSSVIRFNTMTNGRIVNHSYCHEGPYNSEVYYNVIDQPDASPANYRNIHLQGPGEAMVFGNVLGDSAGGDELVAQSFRSQTPESTSEGNCNSTCNGTVTGSGANAANADDGNRGGGVGYPCWHQFGRNSSADLRPVFLWENQLSGGTLLALDIQSGAWTSGGACADTTNSRVMCHVRKNRDYYEAVSASIQSSASSPFDGTTGMGFGTLANRPTTCTTGAAADSGNGGVGYWCTDCGNWNKSSSNNEGVQKNGEDGVLYMCSATNTWTEQYTPYEYPHPLRGESPDEGPTNNLVIILGSFVLVVITALLGGLYGKGIARIVWNRAFIRAAYQRRGFRPDRTL
jgi:hypothetical protein